MLRLRALILLRRHAETALWMSEQTLKLRGIPLW